MTTSDNRAERRLNNKYTVRKPLKSGGMSQVWVGYDEYAHDEVAIKIPNRDFTDEHGWDMLRDEVNALRGISDDSLVKYYGLDKADKDGGYFFVAMELIKGPSLEEFCTGKPLAAKQVATVGLRIASGLALAHEKRIFHRDISPDNILLRDGKVGRATLIDFGIAKELSQESKTVYPRAFEGKFLYAPPEQVDGNPFDDGRSDIYSLGMTLLAAANGKAPELPKNLVELRREKDNVPDVSILPDGLREIIERMVQPIPDDRYRTVDDVSEDLEVFLGEATVRGLPDSDEAVVSDHRYRESSFEIWRIATAVAVFAFVALGALGFTKGWFDDLIVSHPKVAPYTFTLFPAREGAPRLVRGYAPSEDAQLALEAAVNDITPGGAEFSISLARGMPGEGEEGSEKPWDQAVAEIIRILGELQESQLKVTDRRVALSASAASEAEASEIRDRLDAVAAAAGLTLEPNLRYPETSTPDEQTSDPDALNKLLAKYDSCGDLRFDARTGEVIGGLPTPEDRSTLRRDLARVMGQGTVDIRQVLVHNPSVCLFKALLAPYVSNDMVIELRTGEAPELNTDAIYQLGDVPVADVVLQAKQSGHILAVLVDNEGRVSVLRPKRTLPEDRVSVVARSVDGVKKIRVMFPISEDIPIGDGSDCSQCYFDFYGNFEGTYMVFAALAREPVFVEEFHSDHEAPAFAEYLGEAIQRLSDKGRLTSVAWQIFEGRN